VAKEALRRATVLRLFTYLVAFPWHATTLVYLGVQSDNFKWDLGVPYAGGCNLSNLLMHRNSLSTQLYKWSSSWARLNLNDT
jgi:hypothetical protein